MIKAQEFTRGQFTYTGADGSSRTVPVDFNPASLDYTITINAQGEGGQTQQVAGLASAKLNLELIFDTTDSGEDVRTKTNKIEVMLRPEPVTTPAGANGPQQAPPTVTFEWGAFKFVGLVDSFKQTMDFFAPNGLPLRATVVLSMNQPNYQFDQQGARNDRDEAIEANVDQAFVLPDGDPSQLAADAGVPGAARDIATANGLESLRGAAGGAIAIGGGVSIGAPVAFSSGAGASAALSLGVGAAASAGVSASAGAFGGLRAGTSSGAASGKYLAPAKLLATASAPGIAPGALFDVTGRAIAQSASSFKADVGARRGLRFDET